MTAHPRHKATHQDGADERAPDALQGTYGSGGSYGVGGGFKDDEPGSRTEEESESGEQSAPELAPDVHTRESEINDEYLRHLKREQREREAAEREREPETRR